MFSTGMWKNNIPEGFPGIEHAEVEQVPYYIPYFNHIVIIEL